MKNLLTILSLLFCSCLMAQKDFKTIKLNIASSSKLIITGSTNVNKFHCDFDTELISEEREIQYLVEDHSMLLNDIVLKLNTKGFNCGNRRMNEDFRDLLKSEEFPEIIIGIDKIQFISEQYARAFISVCLAGKKNAYELPVKISKNRYQGKLELNIRDFGLEPPKKALGLIEVNEEIEISFDLKINN